MADFNINLAKTMVSPPEARLKFYNRMLLYLVACAAAMVYVAYLASLNIVKAVQARQERVVLVRTGSASSEYGEAFYKNPEKAYRQLSGYTKDLETLSGVLARRAQFLPVLNQLFADFPEEVALQNLTGTGKTIEFGLVAPLFGQQGENPVSQLQNRWKLNEELMQKVVGIRQVTSERRMVGDIAMVFVKFECILK